MSGKHKKPFAIPAEDSERTPDVINEDGADFLMDDKSVDEIRGLIKELLKGTTTALAEDASIMNPLDAHALVHAMKALRNAGHDKEARKLAEIISIPFRVTPATKLMIELDLEYNRIDFDWALSSYLKHLRLKPEKQKNFPIDKVFLKKLLDSAIAKGQFKPLPEEDIPQAYLVLSFEDIMFQLSDKSGKSIQQAYLLSALYILLQS